MPVLGHHWRLLLRAGDMPVTYMKALFLFGRWMKVHFTLLVHVLSSGMASGALVPSSTWRLQHSIIILGIPYEKDL